MIHARSVPDTSSVERYIFGLLLLLLCATVASRAALADDELKSAKAWRDRAVLHADTLEDMKSRGQIFLDLAYVQARAGEFEGAMASAAHVDNPQTCVYAYTFVAKQQHAKGDLLGTKTSLDQARRVALAAARNAKLPVSYDRHLLATYFELGLGDEALTYFEALPDGLGRYMAACDYATELAKAGDVQAALEFKHPALKTSGPGYSFNEQDSADARTTRIGQGCAQLARVADTLRCVARISDAEKRDNVYGRLIESLVEKGDTAEAARHLDRISDPTRRARAKGLVEAERGKSQSVDALRAATAKAETREEQLPLLQRLFEKLLTAGQLPEAETTLEEMLAAIDRSPRPEVGSKFGTHNDQSAKLGIQAQYARVAEALAAAGDQQRAQSRLDSARKAVEQMPDLSGLDKFMALAMLTQSQLKVGDIDGARKLVESLPENFARSTTATAIALAYVRRGDAPSAVAMAKLVRHELGRGDEIGRVAEALIRAGHIAEAREVLGFLGDAPTDGQAYRDVGKAMIAGGHAAELRQWLDKMPGAMACAYACLGAAEQLVAR